MLRVPVGEAPLIEQVETFRRAVRRQVEGNDYDAIHFRSAWGGLPICQRKDYLDAKLIFELAISPLAQPRPADKDLAANTAAEEKFCLRQADAVVVHTQSARDYLEGEGFASSVSVVPPGVDVDLFDWEESGETSVPHVMCISRLGPGRGIRTLLRAFQEMLASIEARLVLVGRYEEGFGPTLKEAIRDAEVEKHVTVLGSVEHEDLPRLISLAQVCVSPVSPDPLRTPVAGCPPQVLEFMACRKAVAVPFSPLFQEVAGSTGCFEFFSDGSAGDLAAAVIRVVENRELREELAQSAYQRVRSAFTASGSRRLMLAMYREVLPEPQVLSGRPALQAMPGVMEADPRTTTARKFKQFHDTSTHPGVPGSVTVTPTARAVSEPETGTWELVVRDSHEETQRMGVAKIDEDGVVEIDESDFVAAGELLGSADEEPEPDEGTRPDSPSKPG
jgi:glycosyltransferase involved in cell wall biosynthesis